MVKELDFEYNDTIICPYCAYELEDPFEYELDEDGEEIECPECGKEFTAWVNHSISYSSKRISCAKHEHDYKVCSNYQHRDINVTIYKCEKCLDEVYLEGELKEEKYIQPLPEDKQ